MEEQKKEKPKKSEKPKVVKYSGRFVKESFGDKHGVSCGEYFEKEWTFRNDGKVAWPEDTVFIQTNGDDLKIEPMPITSVVQPEGEYTWTLRGKAPEKEGRYSAYFRMVTGNNQRFGHKVWVDILVEEDELYASGNDQIMPVVEEPIV
jgi:next-to-BRCA1 protein 1